MHPVIDRKENNDETTDDDRSAAAATVVQAAEIRLELQGKGLAGNQIRVAVYSATAPEQFPSDEKFYRGTVSEATTDHVTVTVPDLPPGKYAVAAYVDNNKNGRQDKNFLACPGRYTDSPMMRAGCSVRPICCGRIRDR